MTEHQPNEREKRHAELMHEGYDPDIAAHMVEVEFGDSPGDALPPK